jgi:hypothetical protein
MGMLTDDLKMLDSRKNAGQLINTLVDMVAQFQTVNGDIAILKTKIKADVQNDTWNGEDIESLGRNLQIKAGILAKRPKYKTALQTLKTLVSDATYEAEIQVEIDKL